MGISENPLQYQQLLNVSFGDAVELFHTRIAARPVLLVRNQRTLHCYRREAEAREWKVLWFRDNFFDAKQHDFASSFFAAESGWLLVRNREGLQFYRLEGDSLALRHYCSDERYRDAYGWNDSGAVFLMGHIYADATKIGVLARNKRGAVRFEQMQESVVLNGGPRPLWQLQGSVQNNLPASWKLNTTWLGLATTNGTGQSTIIERSSDAVSVYKLDSNYDLHVLGRAENVPFAGARDERILFGNLLGRSEEFSDLLHLNSTGMLLYRRAGTRYLPFAHSSSSEVGFGSEKKHRNSASLIDVDGDGRDELWMNGPQGIVGFRVSEGLFEYIPFQPVQNEDLRFAQMIKAIHDGRNVTTIAVSGRNLVSFPLHYSNTPSKEVNESAAGNGQPMLVQREIQSIFALETHTEPLAEASLGEQLDASLLIEPINPMTGNVEFAIPLLVVGKLFGMSPVKFISYQEASSASGSMGVGWSLQTDCVYIDRMNSIFPENHRYYLIRDGTSFPLTAVVGGSIEQVTSFTTDSHTQMRITFNRTLNQWIVEDDNGESFFYGAFGEKRAVAMESGSEDWPFLNERNDTEARLPSVWYLLRQADCANQWLEYAYTKQVQTNDYQLLSITTSNSASLQLSYSNLFNSTLLTGFSVHTGSYYQSAAFHYAQQDEKVLLKRITQQSNTVMAFEYDGPYGAMSKILYPNGLVANFDYTVLQIDRNVLMNRFETHSQPRTAYGPTYLLIGDITRQGQVRLQVRDTLGSDTVPVAGGSVPALGKLPVVDYAMYTGETFFAVLLHHESSPPELCLFHALAGVWQATPTYLKLPKGTSVRAGHDFLLAVQEHRVTVIERVKESWKALKPFDVEKSSLVHYFSHGFLTYDDRQLRATVRRDGQWTAIVLPLPPNLMQTSASVFDRFDHPADVLQSFRKGIRLDALQMFHNVVVVRSLFLEGFKLYARLHLLQLNWKHDVARQSTIDVLIEDLSSYTFNPPEADGNTFVFAYRLESDKFRLKIVHHRGKIMDEVEKIKAQIEQDIRDHPDAPEAEKNRYRAESHERLNSELDQLYRNITSQVPFAIDPAKFGMIVNDAHIVTASHKALFDGIDWKVEKIPQEALTLDSITLDLGPSYRLVKTHRNATFDLIGPNNVTVLNTDTSNATDLHIRYPAFLAVQINGTAAQLFNFHRQKLTSLPAGEILDANSNSLAVLSSTTDGKRVFVRSLDSFGVTQKHVVWRHEFVDSNRHHKLTHYYEFNAQTAKPYSDGFLMRDVKISPAHVDGRNGWFAVRYNFANSTQSTKSVYDSKGKFVRLVEPAADTADSNKAFDADGVLTARDGTTVVADFRPFRITEETVSYYGFEPYEQNRVGSGDGWRWTGGAVQREQGNHFLRLNRAARLSATMRPKLQHQSLIVSCWIRAPTGQQNSESALSVEYSGKVVNGAVAFSAGGWSYVEAAAENTNQLKVTISSASNSHLDIDHVRVFPAQLDLKVHIYDTTLARERSTLHASGLLSHRLYDTLGNEMGQINEQGSIEHLSIVSRTGNSRIEIHPAQGEMLHPSNRNTYSGSWRYVPETVVLRFRYSADATQTGTIHIDLAGLKFKINVATDRSTLTERSEKITIPRRAGDVVIFCSNKHYSVWIDGQLKLEHLAPSAWSDRYTIASKSVPIADVLLLYDVSMKVIHLTGLGMPRQILELKQPGVVAVQQILYDALNRPAVKTKWTELDTSESSDLFEYREKFVENEEQFWKTGHMEGMVARLNADCEGFPYSRTVYVDNPLEEKAVQSVPGKPFAIDGPFAKHYRYGRGVDFLANLFPASGGFYYEYEHYPDQSVYVEVHDKRKLKVASYVKTHHGDHQLTTYLYDASDRLVLQLPPAYHEQADTFSRTTPFFGGTFASEHIELQRAWGTRYEYDQQSGLLTLKRSPDAGSTRYLYTPEGLLRFVVQQNSSSVMYYTYNAVGKLQQRGIVELELNELVNFLPNDSDLPSSSNFILLQHGDSSVAPLHRHRVENIKKVSQDHSLSDVLLFNDRSQIVTSALYSSGDETLAINYRYRKDRLHELHYPATVKGKQFRVRLDYDNRGNLIGIANALTDEKLLTIDNNSLGLPKRMHIQPSSRHAYQRTFHYNEPGYLTQIEDPYLSETIDYSGPGYGGRAIGDGTVQATRFNATWHAQHGNAKLLKLKPSHLGTGRRARLCYDALVSDGYLDAQGRPVKSFYHMLELRLPIVCRLGTYGHQLAAALNSRGFPEVYGHRYDYGSHRQLIRGKYFQGSAEELLDPLRTDAFERIAGISRESSVDIWEKLREGGFLHADCYSTSVQDCHGSPGKSLFHPTIAEHPNGITLGNLLVRVITQRKNLPKNTFDQLCAGWYQEDLEDTITATCNTIWTMLQDAGFIGANSNFSLAAINQELRDALSEYAAQLPAIVGVLHQKFATALGRSSADVQSYKIDANGNHQQFYTGFRRYRLEYVPRTNKIAYVYRTDFAARNGLEEVRYQVEHNEEGSVTRAAHKAIERIVYDPLFNRATRVMLFDGRYLEFEYDVRGYRLYKRVYDAAGRLIRKKYYIRDVQGKPLVEYEGVYEGGEAEQSGSSAVRATVFLYAGNRLVGFMRNNQFYSVWLDHEGSVRLVIKDGEVVAAYDYLPYGETLRTYGDSPEGHLDYRFAGKEWDAETNLYDFHARLYDPELGRFLQMDPKEQYASPYLYAGNSPVSLIDPDGQFAFLIVAALAIGGAYVGASAANNSWNPTKWTLKKALLGGLVGGLIGGLAPVAIGGSFAFLSGYIGATAAIGVLTATSVGFAYVSLASANGSWDPSKWDWSQPGTWNALFVGSLTGASLFNAIGGIHKAFAGYAGLSRAAFVIVTSGTTGGFLLYSGSMANDGNLRFWEWDWSNPATVWGAIEGASFGLSISPKLNSVTQQVASRLENLKEIGKSIKANDLKTLGKLLKEEAKAWQQIYKNVLSGDTLQDAITAGKAAGRPGGTILLDKIPDGAMKVIDEILLIEKLLPKIKKTMQKRSVEYSNVTNAFPPANPLQNGNSLMKLEHCAFCSQDGALFVLSASNKLSNWINRIFEGVFQTNRESKNTQYDRRDDTVTLFEPRKKQSRSTFQVSNCFRAVAEQPESNRIVCYEPYGLSYVFPHNTSSVIGITEDHYSLCYPLEYDGFPSAACAGTNSSYIFTPHSRPVNYLDHLNGALTLLLVAPAAAKNAASFVRNLLFGSNKDREEQLHNVSKQEQEHIDEAFKTLAQSVNEYRQLADDHNVCKWLNNVFNDIEDDVTVFLSSDRHARQFYCQLLDRIEALREEIRESKQIVLHTLNAKSLHSLNNFTYGVHTPAGLSMRVNDLSLITLGNVDYRIC